jgi:hypothetical protein
LSSDETESLDQALFGYSDGHRQIAASLRLPSKDLFLLSSASDLASGAILRPGDSYLTGLPLAESKKYALIRTWPAPEMPRPGCVWSHVLIIDFRILSTRNDLSDFLPLFTAHVGNNGYDYSKKLEGPPRGGFPEFTPDVAAVTDLLQSYYLSDTGLLDGNIASAQREAAVIAVWSQQWPKLRIGFSFRTAVTQERRRAETAQFDVQMRSLSEMRPTSFPEQKYEWLKAAAADATSRSITPLRRFLWRYGRDVQAPRRFFPWLVTFYEDTTGALLLSAEEARRVLDAFPEPNDAQILKRDILGIGSGTLPLVGQLPVTDFFRLAKQQQNLTDVDIERRISEIRTADILPLAMMVEQDGATLDPWARKMLDRIAEAADSETILEEELPAKIRSEILRARPDLIDDKIARRFSDRALKELVLLHGDDEFTSRIADTVVSRDFGHTSEQLLVAAPISLTKAAVALAGEGALSRGWLQAFSWQSSRLPLLAIFRELRASTDVVRAIFLLRLSPRAPISPQDWSQLLDRLEDDSSGEARINFYAFLLVAGLTAQSSSSWRLVFAGYPAIREAVVKDQLPSAAYQWLNNELQRFHTAQYWDLDKRIVLSIARLNQTFPHRASFANLHLTKEEASWLASGLEEEDERSKSRFWWF